MTHSHGGNQEQQYFTAQELSAMINAYIKYWTDPGEKSDIEAEAANLLHRNCLNIADQLLALLTLVNTPVAAETRQETHY